MNTTKMILPAALTIFLAGGALFATTAISGPHDGYGYGHGMMQGDCNGPGMGSPCPGMYGRGMQQGGGNISPEQRQKLRDMVQESDAKIQPMRDQMYIKGEEMRALQNSANPDVKAVSQKAAEINALREQMRKERVALGEKIDKELGLEPGTHNFGGYGHGGRGHRGYGHGGYHKGGNAY